MAAFLRCLSLSLIVLPPVFLSVFLFSKFPLSPDGVAIYPSLASLPNTSRSWQIYPEDYYDGGAYVTFPYGRMRYWLLGPDTGQKIVLIHGLSVPAMIWKDVAPELARKGFRVLLFDLYGRGYSDAPRMPYDSALYSTQLALLMQHVKWDSAYIVGTSMGGGVAAAFVALFPQLCNGKLALISSAGVMESNDFSRTSKVMSSPLVQLIASSPPIRMFMQYLSSGDPLVNPLHEIVRIQSSQLPGYNLALASSLREGPLRGLNSTFETIASQSVQVLLIWGTHDRTVPYKYSSYIKELIPTARLVTVEEGPHDLPISHPQIVLTSLVDFFSTSGAPSLRRKLLL